MTRSRNAPPRQRREPPFDPRGEIAARLRMLYSEIEQEPIPAELIALLERLDEAEDRSKP